MHLGHIQEYVSNQVRHNQTKGIEEPKSEIALRYIKQYRESVKADLRGLDEAIIALQNASTGTNDVLNLLL